MQKLRGRRTGRIVLFACDPPGDSHFVVRRSVWVADCRIDASMGASSVSPKSSVGLGATNRHCAKVCSAITLRDDPAPTAWHRPTDVNVNPNVEVVEPVTIVGTGSKDHIVRARVAAAANVSES